MMEARKIMSPREKEAS
jgi:hypothetical protein